MSAIDNMCRALDDDGIEYDHSGTGMLKFRRDDITYCVANAWPRNDPSREKVILHVGPITPEQAIAIARRTDTCQADETNTWECVRDDMGGYGKKLTIHVMECTECGHTYEHVNGDYEFCPRCGKRIEEG